MSVDTALLVIDVQVGLFEGAHPAYEGQAVLAHIHTLLDRARQDSTLVIYIQHDGEADHPVAVDTPGWHIHPAIVPQANDLIIRKQASDAFFNTPLHELLAQRGIHNLVIVGYATEFCVDTTSRRAASLGYHVTVVADAHTTADRPILTALQIIAHHNWTLANVAHPTHPILVAPAAEVHF